MFLNISNHPICRWSSEQLKAAQDLSGDGVVLDVAFPNVNPSTRSEEIGCIASDLVKSLEISSDDHLVVLVQGEFTLTVALVSILKEMGVTVVAACSERNVTETTAPDGSTTKVVKFDFVQFRKYL